MWMEQYFRPRLCTSPTSTLALLTPVASKDASALLIATGGNRPLDRVNVFAQHMGGKALATPYVQAARRAEAVYPFHRQ